MPGRGDRRVLQSTTRKKTLKPRRVRGGFAFSAPRFEGHVQATAVATDAAGNRSKALAEDSGSASGKLGLSGLAAAAIQDRRRPGHPSVGASGA